MAAADAEGLVAEISREAQAERERIAAGAAERARGIRDRAEAALKRLAEDGERSLAARLAAERERIDGGLRMELGRRKLEAMREALDAAYEEARGELARRSATAAYARVFERLVREALEAAGEPGQIVVAAQDAERCRQLLAALGVDATIRAEAGDPGAVVVTSRDGLRSIDNGIGTRLARLRELGEEEAARVLFQGLPP